MFLGRDTWTEISDRRKEAEEEGGEGKEKEEGKEKSPGKSAK